MNKRVKKKILKIYKAQLNFYNKRFSSGYNCVDYFITYLRFLRDMAIINSTDPENDLNVISLCCAITEYENSINCINAFYNVSDKYISYKSNDNKREVDKEYQKTKLEYLTKCLLLIRDNLANWVYMNDYKI